MDKIIELRSEMYININCKNKHYKFQNINLKMRFQ